MNVPHDLDAEAEALSGAMLSRDAREYAIGALSAASFYDTHHKAIWAAILVLFSTGKPCDVTTISEEMARQGTLDRCGGRQYVLGIFSQGSSLGARAHIDYVANLAARRQILDLGESLRTRAADMSIDPAEIVAGLERDAETVRLPAEPVRPPVDLDDFLAIEDQPEEFLVPKLLARGERQIITAPEGHGKSEHQIQQAVMLACGLHPYYGYRIRKSRTLLVDLENRPKQLRHRLRKFRELAGEDYQGGFAIETRSEGLNLRDPRDFRWLDEKIESHRPELLVIGPLYKMFRAKGSESKADETAAEEAAYAVDRLIARHDIAVSIEAHSPHGHQGDREHFRPIGASLWLRWPEFGIALVPVPGEGPITVKLRHWRGARDRDRQWPSELRQGAVGQWPWIAVTEELRAA